jgi:hypothetical protein
MKRTSRENAGALIVTDFLTDPGSAARVPATAARRAS